jgi:hypothetical protein
MTPRENKANKHHLKKLFRDVEMAAAPQATVQLQQFSLE